MPIVAGGGISGLSAAYYISKKYCESNLKLLILEASNRLGGWVKSDPRPNFTFEAGPRTIRPSGDVGANTLNLIEEIGLTDSVIPISTSHVAARNRLIYAKGKLNLLPTSLSSLFVTKAPFTKPLVSALWHDYNTAPKLGLQDDTTHNFISRRFGQELADYAIAPMICGICAGDSKEISIKFLMDKFFEMEQKHGSFVKGIIKNRKNKTESKVTPGELARLSAAERWSIYSFKEGLEELPKRLETVLSERNIQIYPKHEIREIMFDDNKKVNVKIDNDYAFCSDHLFSCLPSYKLAELLKKTHPKLSDELEGIPFVDVAVVNLQYDADHLKEKAFGFLVPPIEKLPILGVIYDSCCFSHQKGTVLTVMMGGKWFKEYFGENPTEEQLLDIALDQIRNILKIQPPPDTFKVNVLRKCIPQYVVGHRDRVERIRKYIQDENLPLSICGSSYDGVGVNDVIFSSHTAVQNVNLSS